MSDKLVVDKEFAALIPPLKENERAQLEENIKQEGCRDALVVWSTDGKQILLDGHNRHEICTRLKLPFKIIQKQFQTRMHAVRWILLNQVGRRNLPADVRAVTALKAYRIEALISKKERGAHANAVRYGKSEPRGTTGKSTRQKIAKIAGIPVRKLQAVAEIEKRDPSKKLLTRIEKGEISIAEARRQLKQTLLLDKLESVGAMEKKKLKGKYDVIVCNPPWPSSAFEAAEDVKQIIAGKSVVSYPPMSVDRLDKLLRNAFEKHMTEDCHLFLWVNQRFLPIAFGLLEDYALDYVCTFVWHKPGGPQPLGLPKNNVEFVIYARKGEPEFLEIKNFQVCFEAGRTKYREKPIEFYQTIARVTAGRRLDMFNRRKIEGFDGWGAPE